MTATPSLTPMPTGDPVKQFQAFKTQEKCVKAQVATSTKVYSFSSEGAQTKAGTSTVYACPGMGYWIF